MSQNVIIAEKIDKIPFDEIRSVKGEMIISES